MTTFDTQDAIDCRTRHLFAIRRPRRDLAEAMHRLIRDRTENPLKGVPIFDLDAWAVENAPDLIAEAEATSGVPHWTNRAGTEFAELPDADNTRPPDLVDRYPRGISEYRRAMDRLAASALRHDPGA